MQALFRMRRARRAYWDTRCAVVTIQRALRRYWRHRAPLAGWERKLQARASYSAASQLREARRQPTRMIGSEACGWPRLRLQHRKLLQHT